MPENAGQLLHLNLLYSAFQYQCSFNKFLGISGIVILVVEFGMFSDCNRSSKVWEELQTEMDELPQA